MGDPMGMNNSTDIMTIPEGVDESAALAIAIFQTILLVFMGPTVLFYGPAVFKSVIFVQALFAANYVAFVSSVAAVDAFTAFDVWDRFVVMATGTLTLTFAAIKSQNARAASQGAVLGVLIATPLTQLMRDLLFVNWVGCTGFGAKGGAFPEGRPLGCDLHSTEFQVAFQCSRLVFWLITAAMAYIGKKVTNISIAMTGASMLMKGLMDLIQRIAVITMPDQATSILSLISPLRTFIGYGIAGVGVMVQLAILKETTVEINKKPVKRFALRSNDEVRARPGGKFFVCFLNPIVRMIIVPLTWFDKFLTIRMEGKDFLPSTDDLKKAAEKAVTDKAKAVANKATGGMADKALAAAEEGADAASAADVKVDVKGDVTA